MVRGTRHGVVYEDFLGHRVILQAFGEGTKADAFATLVWKRQQQCVRRRKSDQNTDAVVKRRSNKQTNKNKKQHTYRLTLRKQEMVKFETYANGCYIMCKFTPNHSHQLTLVTS